MRARLIAILVPLLVLAMAAVGNAAAAPGGGAADVHASDHAAEQRAEVVAFWTPERVRSAVPRLPVIDGGVASNRPEHAGGPKGGGDKEEGADGSTTGGDVTGAPWPGQGDIEDMVGETTGKVLFEMKGGLYVCSGSTVDGPAGRSIVLTAGHCLHDGDNSPNSWATMWMFVPAYEDGGTFTTCSATAYGCWTAKSLTTTATWFAGGEFSDDVGFAVMSKGGKLSDSQDDLVETVGSQPISFTTSVVGESASAFGYPAAQKYKGDDLIYCAGTGTDYLSNGTVGLGCDMTGGSSGGPWYAGFNAGTASGTAVSVNSHVYRSIKNVMFGPVFDEPEQAAYDLATGASSGTGAKSNG